MFSISVPVRLLRRWWLAGKYEWENGCDYKTIWLITRKVQKWLCIISGRQGREEDGGGTGDSDAGENQFVNQSLDPFISLGLSIYLLYSASEEAARRDSSPSPSPSHTICHQSQLPSLTPFLSLPLSIYLFFLSLTAAIHSVKQCLLQEEWSVHVTHTHTYTYTGTWSLVFCADRWFRHTF